ncbi:MAG: nitrite reductase/ring-hydroxylating ferredoxin subunit [Flavobacterium sp.]|jgi:nitrite reductase/ring-hydroxylating ferredoxin subunit
MNKLPILFLFFLSILISSCDGGSFNNQNPYLPNYQFTFEVNTNLPLYSGLKFTGNSIRVFQNGAPTNGVILFNNGTGILAFDGSCPNQAFSSCSSLVLNSSTAVCPCDDASYNLFTGQAAGKQYPLKAYRVEVNGNLIRVFN